MTVELLRLCLMRRTGLITRATNVALALVLTSIVVAMPVAADERTERFDRDPKWDSHNNRPPELRSRTIVQDFGYSATAHAGGKSGELGGLITPAAEGAYYAKKIPIKTFDDALTASGTLACTGRPFHVLVGFFNAGTINEWRTPNTIALRLSGRGDVFYAWLEYATSRWRAGGDDPRGFATVPDAQSGRMRLKGFPVDGAVHQWTLRYDPNGNGGSGVITATIGDETAICNIAEGHRADGAKFDHFGLLTVSKSADTGGELWMDDLTINGEREDFSADPDWDGFQNRRTYNTTNIRPQFDFGFSPTQFAGGRASGELGGIVFRGDCRYPHMLAYYGDRLNDLNLNTPLRASGKVGLRRGVTDSTVLFGFFNSEQSILVNPAQDSGLPRCFLGIGVEGPSREGFLFAPAYRSTANTQGFATGAELPHIHPDGAVHNWTLQYDPPKSGNPGQLIVTLDGKPGRLEVRDDNDAAATRFDRFGLVTTWIDGNAQHIYFDDLTYTFSAK